MCHVSSGAGHTIGARQRSGLPKRRAAAQVSPETNPSLVTSVIETGRQLVQVTGVKNKQDPSSGARLHPVKKQHVGQRTRLGTY